jgi:cytochrome b
MRTIKVWDLFVRVFHWSLVAAIIIQLLTAEEAKSVHAAVGYAIVVLLVLRIIWGFVGPKHARFNDFIYPPTAVLSYLNGLFRGRPKHYTGHNPAGGAMVCLLLLTLALTTLTGLLAYGAEGKGPFAFRPASSVGIAVASDEDDDEAHRGKDEEERGYREGAESHRQDGGEGESFWKEIHEALVGLLLLLAGVHLLGVLASSYVHKENLILAMITGKKKIP